MCLCVCVRHVYFFLSRLGSCGSTTYHSDCIGFWNVRKCDTQLVLSTDQLLMETIDFFVCVCCGKILWSFNTNPRLVFNKREQSQKRKRKLHLNSNWPKITAEPLGHRNLSLFQTLPTVNASFCLEKWEMKWLKHFGCCHVYPHASLKDDITECTVIPLVSMHYCRVTVWSAF